MQTLNEDLYESRDDSKHFKQVLERMVNLAKSVHENKVKLQVVEEYMELPENKPHQAQFRDFCIANGITMQITQRHEWGDRFEPGIIECSDRYPCLNLGLYPTVSHMGNLMPCCINFFDEMPYGSHKTKTVAKVWNCSAAKDIRKTHLAAKCDENKSHVPQLHPVE